MKCPLLFLLFGIPFTYQLSSRHEYNLGPFDASVQLANLTELYLPLSSQDENASNNVKNELENRRKSFSAANFPLPALDPYYTTKLSPISLNEQVTSLAVGNIYVKAMKITGAKHLQLESLEIRMKTLRTDVKFNIPLIVAEVKFTTDVTIAGWLPVHLSGLLRIKLQSVKVVAAIQSKEKQLQNHTSYQLSALHASFHADNVNVIVASPKSELSLLEIFESVDSTTIESVKHMLSVYVANKVMREINGILAKFSKEQVKAYLLN